MTPSEKPALLLIDFQEEFWENDVALDFKDVPANTARLLAVAREHGVEVVHLRVQFKADKSDWPPNFREKLSPIEGSDGARVLPWAVEAAGEKVFIKHSFDAFASTELEGYLRERGIGTIYACGFITSICVNLTCATAHQRGFKTFVIEDCCGDFSLERHESTLNTYNVISFRAKSLAQAISELSAGA